MVFLKMKRYKKAFLLLLVTVLFSCTGAPSLRKKETGVPLPITEKAQPDFLTIIAAGDNLYHDKMILAGEQGDYNSVYQELLSLVERADIAFINQETLLAGKDFGFSGYPQFNSPQELGRAISAAGFNVVNHASNHIMDKGEEAVFATMDFWDTIPRVTVLGIHRSEEQRSLPKLVTKNNITVGFLSYTYGTNNIPVPDGKAHLVSVIDTEIMAEEIDALRPLCDFLVVSMHWGEEYQSSLCENQETLAAFLAEHLVDLVIGHHPHVIQPIEYIPRPDNRFMLCFYSLGNLISAQNQNPTLLGALAYVRIKKRLVSDSKEGDGIVFADAGVIPLVTHYEKEYTGFKVYPLYAYTGELLEKHWKNQAKKELTMEYLNGLAAKSLGEKEIRFNTFEREEVDSK